MLKVIGKVFYFIFILLFFYIMYTFSNASLINTYYNNEVYPHLNDSSVMIDKLVVPFGDRYDNIPIYQASSTVEGKKFEINFFAFEATNNSPGIFITFNNFDFNQNDILYINAKFDVGNTPSGTYSFQFDENLNSKQRHFIRIMLNYDENEDYAYFTYRNNDELIKELSINNFVFSYSLDGVNYLPFLNLKSINNSNYDHTFDHFSSQDDDIFVSNNFYGSADRFNILNKELSSIVTVDTKVLTQYNYIIYRNMALSIIGAFILTFVIFYRKLILHWFKQIKEKKQPA